MSDLRRWSEEGATAEELSLLEVARRRRAEPAQRAAVLSAIGVGAATTAAGAASGAGLALKLVGVALLASAGAGLAFFHSGTGAPSSTPAASAVAARTGTPRSTPAPIPEDPAPASSEPAAGELASPEVTAKVGVKPKSAPAPAPASSLSRELQVLKQAHDALGKGNPNGALAALDDYHARFPQGTLGAEETVIRVQALLARGDRERASAVARQFSKAHPESLYAQRVEALVAGVK